MKYFIVFMTAVILLPIMRKVAVRFNITDKPAGDGLKIHPEPVALLGGGVIFCAIIMGLVLFSKYFTMMDRRFILGFFAGCCIIFGVGLWDDIKTVYPYMRLAFHVLAGSIIIYFGLHLRIGIPVWIAGLLTIAGIVFLINAFNMIDGMDGLCAGIALISCTGFFLIGKMQNDGMLMILSGILGMALGGFLPYNFFPAKIFLGDAGSGLIGFLIGVMAIMAINRIQGVSIIGPVLIAGIPVFDLAFAVVRRLVKKRPLFGGDRDHIYDVLLHKGLTQRTVWFLLCGIQAVCVGIALCFLNVL